ncbi:sodium/potassium-transporting ATPase subunit alpha-like [Copidosoma floridanum]|uniref:sodium/potassium-transporting ATPase subunit alpha-like n=1 Tax=Copidosoma floridanum TaxID=29053 RepID=UPI0006C95D10|nr:sodium/potassium-transporting ATPase subunit alpha-like [Copidosoma floridanum]
MAKEILNKVSAKLGRKSSLGNVPQRRYTNEELEILHAEPETQDHVIPIKRLCDKLNSHPSQGMSSEAAALVLAANGHNVLTPPKMTPEYVKFFRCMFTGFATLLWMCALLCLVLYAIGQITGHDEENIEYMALIITVICLISGVFAYNQESKNTKIMESFKNMVPTMATVIRGGVRLQLPAEEVVVGDLVEIRLGDKIPADIRIIESRGLRVENSSITGESEPTTRTDHPTDANPLESKNVAFFSSFAVSGEGTGIVIATGDNTMIGRLAGLTTNLSTCEPPLTKEIRHFVHLIVIIAMICGGCFFVLVLSVDGNVILAFSYLLGIVISNVPEVLLITVTTSLTLSAKKMADKNCLVKNLEAVETLGSTSTICSDKTGTLTQNKMTVSNLWFGNARHHFPPNTLLGVERDLLLEKPAFNIFIKDATLCLRAEFRDEPDPSQLVLIEERRVIGDASETGILKFCEHIWPTKAFRAAYPKVAEIPFNSATKYQLSIHKDVNGFIVIVKGAPEVVIDFCTTIMAADGSTRDITPEDSEEVKKACTEMGFLGERVLAYCDYVLPVDPYNSDYEFNTSSPENYNFPMQDYRFVGLVSLVDPPRPFVYEAVHKCRSAGIKVIMVTGDHPVTAIAIAKLVGIISEGHETHYEKSLPHARAHSIKSGLEDEAVVITGNELRNMNEFELDYTIRHYEEIVFARTSPQQKLFIVESLQRLGEIVAVTGDGVNDSPALRKADIGVAMGIAGSDVAKNAADMILMDDNFASIVTGIEEGRLIFDNLKKSIAYTLTSSVPEMLPMLASVIFSIPLPFVLELVMCVDIGTDLLPAIALAYEKAESDIMHRTPRNPQYDKLVNKRLISMTYGQIGMTQAMAGFYTYYCILMFHGFLPQDLFGLRAAWENRAIDDLKDSYGQTWDYQSRMDLLNEARTGYFLSIVITQMVDLIMCKTRKNSIIQQGMSNWSVNFAFVFEAALTCALLYIPGTEKMFKTMPLDLFWYWPCLPLALLLWVYDEFRRLWIRTNPGCFLERETYY